MQPDGFGARLINALARPDDTRTVALPPGSQGVPWRVKLLHALGRTATRPVISPYSSLVGVHLRDADLTGGDLTGVDLRGSDLYGARLRRARLRTADLSLAHLRGADLRGADLTDATLHGADLRQADLRSANLQNAQLDSAILREADLRDADIGGANLNGASLKDAQMMDMFWSEQTLWPSLEITESMRRRSRQQGGGRWRVVGSGTLVPESPPPVVPVA